MVHRLIGGHRQVGRMRYGVACLCASSLLCAILTSCAATTASRETREGVEPATLGARPTPVVAFDPRDVSRDPWQFAAFDGERILTPHYEVHTTVRSRRMRERLPRFLESAMAQYTQALADLPKPPDRLTTFILADRRQWEAKTLEVLPDQAELLNNLGRGGFATRGVAILYDIDWSGRTRDTFAIAAHEGWHQYTQTVFRNPLPVWLEEGIATTMEGHRTASDGSVEFLPYRNGERRRALGRAAFADRLIPFKELVSQTPQTFLAEGGNRLLTYYSQVWALTLFLIDGQDGRHQAALAQALEDAAAGRLTRRIIRSPYVLARGARLDALRDRNGPWLILEYFNHDLRAFETEYLRFIEGLLEHHDLRGGLAHPAG